MRKDFGVPAEECGKIFERVKRIVGRSAEAIMIIWVIVSFSLLTIWISLEYKELKNQKIVDSPHQNRTKEEIKCQPTQPRNGGAARLLCGVRGWRGVK